VLSTELEHLGSEEYFTAPALAAAAKRRRVEEALEAEAGPALAHTLGYWWGVASLDYHAGYAAGLAAQTPQDLRRFVRALRRGAAVRGRCAGAARARGCRARHAHPVRRVHRAGGHPDGRREAVMRRVAGSQARRQILGGALLAFGAAAGVAACASARPEQRLAVADADGRRVSFDSATTRFDVDGVRVIHRPNHGTEVVAVNLYLLGGTRQLDAGTQGVEALLVRAGEYGSAAYPGEAQRAAWGRTGSVLVASTDADWTLYGFRGVRDEFDASWNVWADRLLRPTLAEHDLAVVRARLVSRARRRRADPDGLAMLAADSVAFAGHRTRSIRPAPSARSPASTRPRCGATPMRSSCARACWSSSSATSSARASRPRCGVPSPGCRRAATSGRSRRPPRRRRRRRRAKARRRSSRGRSPPTTCSACSTARSPPRPTRPPSASPPRSSADGCTTRCASSAG
jgi:hypothetical protein